MASKLNINLFFEGLARALTAQYQERYPGIEVTVRSIELKPEYAERRADNDFK